jgi:hypothetical protein
MRALSRTIRTARRSRTFVRWLIEDLGLLTVLEHRQESKIAGGFGWSG